ncbi:MAG: methylenetetrahydrofolate reductase C-terminal domain-containing protein [Desulfuromonadaceae bacterium]|nr:methylenetetrahydrofolate reductase C-terminal domain-containing protein [Desulfuromonadaceae bacterium]
MKSIRHWSVRHARSMELFYSSFCKLMPLHRPGIGLLGRKRAERCLASLEQTAKGTIFDCQMCGQCVLSSTGMACPMNCAKQLRNGPCGGVTADGNCEVNQDMPCVWLEAFDGSKRMAGGGAIARIQPPVDFSKRGSSTWLGLIVGETAEPEKAAPAAISLPVREPAPFERICRSGRFIVTAEISPPDSVNPKDLLRRAGVLRGLVDAVNVTDNAGANCHMSSLAASALLAADGFVPVFQSACRDRNRIAMQADIMGAAALGVHNVLCITGDGVGSGDHPQAKPVFDLDSISSLEIVRGMRDQGAYASGRRLISQPDLFLGATANPFAPNIEARIVNLEKKIAAGAQFIQTQFCFDLELFEKFMAEVRAHGLDHHCHLLVGIGPLPSVRTARWLNGNVPGVRIPEKVIHRLEQSQDPKREGIKICIETIQFLREITGVAGVHLMGHKNEPVLAEIIIESGVLYGNGTNNELLRCGNEMAA